MRCSIGSLCDASADSHYLDILLGIAELESNLVVGPPGDEHGKRSGKHGHAGCCHAGRRADHVCLGNAHVKESLRVGLSKVVCFVGALKVGVQYHNVLPLSAQLEQRLAVCIACLYPLAKRPLHHATSWFRAKLCIAASHCSLVMGAL